MNCDDIDRLLSRQSALPAADPAVSAHLRDCPRCAALVDWSGLPAPEPGSTASVSNRIRAFIHADLKPVRPLPAPALVVAAAFGLAVLIALLQAAAMGARGWHALSTGQLAALAILFLTAIPLTALSLIAAIRPGSPRTVPPLVPVLLLAAGFPLLVATLFSSGHQDHFVADGIHCLAGGLFVSAVSAAAAFSLARRGYSTDWRATGSLIGAAGGAIAVLALQISCPDQEVGHLLVWHGLVILTSVAAGFAAGSRA